MSKLDDREMGIIINGSFNNAVEIIIQDTDVLADSNYDEISGFVSDLAEALIEKRLTSFDKHGVTGGDSGNRSSKRSSSSGKRGSSSRRSSTRSSSSRGGSRKRSGGDGAASDKQVDLYTRVTEALEDDGFDLDGYPEPDDLTFEDAKTLIGELMDEAKDRDLEF